MPKTTANAHISRRQVKVINDWGLHARPSAAIATEASNYQSKITISYEQQSAPALSVASLLILEAPKGAVLTVEAAGNDAQVAAEAIVKIITNGFGEEHIVLRGIGSKCGTVIGPAHIVLDDPTDVPHYTITKAKVTAEKKRLTIAINAVRKDFNKLGSISKADDVKDFQKLLLAMLQEDHISKLPFMLIEKHMVNAEWALKINVNEIIEQFTERKLPVWQTRANEYNQVLIRILKQLGSNTAVKQRGRPGANRILIASNISPAEVLEYHKAGYVGSATSGGSATSHAAILTSGLGIPSIVGLDPLTLQDIKEDDIIALDSGTAELHLRPGKNALTQLRKQMRARNKNAPVKHTRKQARRTQTKDGLHIHMQANIEFLEEIAVALDNGAEGIGLFRTEMSFLDRTETPSEDEQYELYRNAIKHMHGRPITFRTLDLSHDKMVNVHATDTARLGVRGIRLSLRHPAMFKDQIRAMLRAAQHGPMQIMLPMISNETEFNAALQLLHDAATELSIRPEDLPKIGVMIEVPGAVFIMRQLAKHCDFFSIGSNDLIQYTLAVDRDDAALAELANPYHPGIICLLDRIINDAKDLHKPLTMCGELATDPHMVRLCCVLGLRNLSMNPAKMDEMHAVVSNFNIAQNALTANKITQATSIARIHELLEQLAD